MWFDKDRGFQNKVLSSSSSIKTRTKVGKEICSQNKVLSSRIRTGAKVGTVGRSRGAEWERGLLTFSLFSSCVLAPHFLTFRMCKRCLPCQWMTWKRVRDPGNWLTVTHCCTYRPWLTLTLQPRTLPRPRIKTVTKTYITTITTMTNILANSCNTVTSIGKRPLCFFLLKPGTENSEIFELLYFYIFAAACFKTRQICYRALWLKWERRSEPFFQTFYRMVVVLLIIIIIR